MQGARRVSRLRWLCRRGMKELDVLLEDFVRRESGRLADGAWPGFEALLGYEDDRLWDLLQGRETAADEQTERLVNAIRN